ncbi:MAG: hypothetical protein M3454_01080 [Actinomycetota bacterium]|nr:hypothetical protein [Actinomycetota bacterium]
MLVLLLSACAPVEEEDTAGHGGAQIEAIEGTDLVRVTMEESAAERLGMESAPVRNAGSQKVIPYAAIFYGPSGETWTYITPEPNIFERAPIEVDRIKGDRVFLLDGPPSGTEVVTQGSAELFGIETGIDQ